MRTIAHFCRTPRELSEPRPAVNPAWLASSQELNLSVLGLIIMFLSEGFESARLVMTQILLVGLKFHPSASRAPHSLRRGKNFG